MDVNKENYESEVNQAAIPVLVDFWGPRCAGCLALMPVVDMLAEKYQGRLKVVKVDASQNRRLCMNLRVMGLPTFLLVENGRDVERIVGDTTSEELVRKVEAFLGVCVP